MRQCCSQRTSASGPKEGDWTRVVATKTRTFGDGFLVKRVCYLAASCCVLKKDGTDSNFPPKPPQTLWFIISIPPILRQSLLFKDQDMWINDILAMWYIDPMINANCCWWIVNTHLFQLLMVYCLLGLPHLSSCKVISGYFCFSAYHFRDG